LILASASSQRRKLLEQAGLSFQVAPVDVDEDLGGFDDPIEAALELARRKARARAVLTGSGAVILGADTVVAVSQKGGGSLLLGKPEDSTEALRMLSRLSGTRHAVVTGVCVVRSPGGREWCAAERTWVHMRDLGEAERRGYVESGEWRGRAGGYAIQESADAFVTRLEEGGFDNVVGLPVALAQRLIRSAQE
jgi:septum formation protein